MQNVINTVKGRALGVAEFLTPILKVSIQAIRIVSFSMYVLARKKPTQ